MVIKSTTNIELDGKLNKTVREFIVNQCDILKNLLLDKNKAYGSSALFPLGVFSKGDAVESLCARMDDKLMRIKNSGINDTTEDTLSDLAGYIILLQIALKIKE
tara:strand:- start:1158 stop:1469 length:312 start_codon:yes stop_codon:yes gene_type:complete